MEYVITPGRMRALEQAFMRKTGTPGLALMERAAKAVCDALLSMHAGGALFLCGPGNNGGDGYAAARLYAQAGHPAWCWALSDPAALVGDAQANWTRCVERGIPVWTVQDALPTSPPAGCGVIVDALFGTGLARPLEGIYARAVRFMNESALPVLSVDMPSGAPDLMVRAARTVTFHRKKPVHLLFPGRINAGDITVADIGLPQADDAAGDFSVLSPADTGALLPPRAPDAHKGTAGHVLVLAGSRGMAGAAALCANAALRGGAGLVTVLCTPDTLPIIQTLAPCATCQLQDALPAALSDKQAIAGGPGLGTGRDASRALHGLLLSTCPQVWDADALNWLSAHPQRLTEKYVLTPHPGEAARLLQTSAAAVVADPIAAAAELHARFGAVILLKGATPVIHASAGRALNITGGPGMATGGSGDVLTGLIAALMGQGLSPYDAARLGAFLHGTAGQVAARARGVRSMTAMDILDSLRID